MGCPLASVGGKQATSKGPVAAAEHTMARGSAGARETSRTQHTSTSRLVMGGWRMLLAMVCGAGPACTTKRTLFMKS